MRQITSILLILWFSATQVSGVSNPCFFHYTTQDGLFHNEIRLIRKAGNGKLWLGTQNGLSSFDGYRFTVYKHDRLNPSTICSDKIYSLETSKTGDIWVGTTAGLCSLNPSTGKSSVFRDTFAIKTNFETSHINNLLEDRSGYLWVSTSWGNYRYSVHNKTIDQVLKGYNIDSYFESGDGGFWICYDNKVGKYDRFSDSFIKNYHADINRLYTDRFGVLWGVGPKGLYRFMPGKGKFEYLPEVKPSFKEGFNSIAEDREGNLFLGQYGGGLTLFKPETGEANHFVANPGIRQAISSNDVYDIFSDESGVVWVGTQEGLDVYDWSRQRFIKWKIEPNNPHGLGNSFIQSIYRDREGFLWLGTRDKGLERMQMGSSLAEPKFDHFYSDESGNGPGGNYITDIFQDSKGRFWTTSWNGGLSLKENKSSPWKYFTHSSSDTKSLASNQAMSITEDRRGRIWIGTLNGLSQLVESGDGFYFKNYRNIPSDSSSLSNNLVFNVFEDSKGRIWLALNQGGLNLMHENSDGEIRFQRFVHDPNIPASISNNEVFVVFEDSKQRIWVGTSFMGFNLLIEERNQERTPIYKFKNYTERDGLSDNETNAILEDDFGFLWISTNKGLSRFNPENETFTNYSEYDGVLKGKFRKNAAWKDSDGTMFFGGAAGVNVFNPTRFKKNTIPPVAVLTEIIIDGISYGLNDSLENKQIMHKSNSGDLVLTLSQNYNRFETGFSAMSYAGAKRNRYAWKLEGADHEWKYNEGNPPGAIFNSLEPGKYKLLLKAANNDGVWGNPQAVLKVVVEGDKSLNIKMLLAGLILLLAGIIIWLIRFRGNRKTKSHVGKISEDNRLLAQKLDNLMKDQKLYLDFKLALSDLASRLDISNNQLSALLNDVIHKPFYDYVNEFRIEEVKRRLISPGHKHKTILAISWECGFNSKSAFNRVFKLNTGLTPSEYQKKYAKY